MTPTDAPVFCAPALARVCPADSLATLVERHRVLVRRQPPGSYYSQFRALLDPPGQVLHVIIATRRTPSALIAAVLPSYSAGEEADAWLTICALREEWEVLTGERPPAWPSGN